MKLSKKTNDNELILEVAVNLLKSMASVSGVPSAALISLEILLKKQQMESQERDKAEIINAIEEASKETAKEIGIKIDDLKLGQSILHGTCNKFKEDVSGIYYKVNCKTSSVDGTSSQYLDHIFFISRDGYGIIYEPPWSEHTSCVNSIDNPFEITDQIGNNVFEIIERMSNIKITHAHVMMGSYVKTVIEKSMNIPNSGIVNILTYRRGEWSRSVDKEIYLSPNECSRPLVKVIGFISDENSSATGLPTSWVVINNVRYINKKANDIKGAVEAAIKTESELEGRFPSYVNSANKFSKLKPINIENGILSLSEDFYGSENYLNKIMDYID